MSDNESRHLFLRRACRDESSMIRVFAKRNKVKFGFYLNVHDLSIIHHAAINSSITSQTLPQQEGLKPQNRKSISGFL